MNENATTYATPTELIDSVIRGDHDEELRAFREAHPELAEQRKNMTRDERTEYIISLLAQLGLIEEETPEEKAARQAYREIDKLLDHQCTSRELGYFYHNYIAHKKASNYDECLLIMDIFNYGKICGKREERARRKREQV